MILHYLVKLEMLIGHVLPLSCYRFIPPQLRPPNSPDLNPVDYSVVRTIAREDVQNTCH